MITERELNQLIKERRKQGNEFSRQAKTIARFLGHKTKTGYTGDDREYKDSDFTIFYDTYGNNCVVHWRGQKVIDYHLGECMRYIPNPEWEKDLFELFIAARRIEIEKEEKERLASLKERMENWGITEEELGRIEA